VLRVSFTVLGDWDKGFDENMRALMIPENRGKASKISVEMVRVIVGAAEGLIRRGRRLRLQSFSKQLREEHGIFLSRRKVREVLIANDLFAARTRKRRPRFYQSLRKEIPNGLVSLDGSEMTVWLDGEPHRFNVELAVDVKTFAHTAFSVGDTETSDEVIKVLEAHGKDWGTPLGVVCDHGRGNLSIESRAYLDERDIELVSVGPYNAKGNGTDEGAFSHMKQALGEIHLDLCSPRSLARGVLEKLIDLYVSMRNRIPVRGNILTPSEGMNLPSSRAQQDMEREHLRDHKRNKEKSGEDQAKLDQLHGLIRYHGMDVEPGALKHAEKTIKGYEREAIGAAQEAFVKAVNRKAERKNLAYFFGILRRIQKERDDEACGRYCHERYNAKVMTELKRQEQEAQESHSIEGIVKMLAQAVKATHQFIKDLAITKANQWTEKLMESYGYPGALKSRLAKAVEDLTDLTLEQRARIWELIELFFNPKTKEESVTRIS